MIDNVLAWGRQNYNGKDSVKDLDGHFSPKQVKAWRRELRQRYKDGDRQVDGNYREGYELTISVHEAIGLTNGYKNGFVVYYRRRPKNE